MFLYSTDGFFTFGFLPIPRRDLVLPKTLLLFLGSQINPLQHSASIIGLEAYFKRPGSRDRDSFFCDIEYRS